MSSSRRSERAPVPPVVLLVGEGQALRDAAVAEIRERVLDGASADFNEDRFDFASGATIGDVLSALRVLPVLSAARLVRVRGLEDRRAAKFLEQVLPEYLDDPLPSTCLLLETLRVDRRARWVKAVEAKGELRRCTPPSRPAELRSWIEGRFGERGKGAARGTAAALLDQLGPDADRLSQEIDKLVLYVGARGQVTPEDVETAAGTGRPHAIFDLTDAIGSRQPARALRVLHQMQTQGEAPLALLAGLANHVRRMIRALDCDPLDPQTVQRSLGVHPYAAQKLVEQVRRFDRRRLRFLLEAVARADRALKGAVPLRPSLAMERLVLALSA